MPVPEFVIARGGVLTAAGRVDEAKSQYALVGAMQRLYADNGVDTDLELALFAADHGGPAEVADAAEQARAEVARRPSVVAHDVLAWTLYRAGDLPAAREASRQALRLGTESAAMRFHAGMIEAALGDRGAAVGHLRAALALNPHFSVRHAPVARATLAELEAAPQEATR
jgi:tetratricopeptide (TPR) repeat protein